MTTADLRPPLELRATRYEVEDRVATITLSRPERHNAWTGRMHAEYRACLACAEADSDVRVVVVTGDGAAFCVGADSRALEGHVERGAYDPGTPADLARPGGAGGPFDADLAFHLGVAKPIVAKLNGAAAGVGFALACFCDVRIAAKGAKLTSSHGKLGLPAEFGLSWLLPRLIGASRATELLLSSRVVLAEEAHDLGLVHQVVDHGELDGAVERYARSLAEQVAPSSLATTKRQLYAELGDGLLASIERAEALLGVMMQAQEFKEGVAALAERRTPRF